MTLAEILPEAQQLPATDKIRLIRFLADDLESAEDTIFPLEPHKVYDLPTPYNVFGVAEGLMDAERTVRRPPNIYAEIS